MLQQTIDNAYIKGSWLKNNSKTVFVIGFTTEFIKYFDTDLTDIKDNKPTDKLTDYFVESFAVNLGLKYDEMKIYNYPIMINEDRLVLVIFEFENLKNPPIALLIFDMEYDEFIETATRRYVNTVRKELFDNIIKSFANKLMIKYPDKNVNKMMNNPVVISQLNKKATIALINRAKGLKKMTTELKILIPK